MKTAAPPTVAADARSLTERLAATPRTLAATAAVARVDEALRRCRPTPAPDDSLSLAAVVAAVLRGADVPDDLHRQRAAEHAEHADCVARHATLTELHAALVAELTAAKQAEAEVVLGVLRTELADVVGAAAALFAGPLRGVDDAQRAIERDLAAEWRAAGELADRYAGVRDEQVRAHLDALAPSGGDKANVVRRVVRAYGWITPVTVGRFSPDNTYLWNEGASLDQLRFAAGGSRRRPWVPDTAELAAAFRAAQPDAASGAGL